MSMYEWPFNLWDEMLKPLIGSRPNEYATPQDLPALYVKNMDAVLDAALSEREQIMVRLRFEQKLTYQKVGDHFGVSGNRARQICCYAQRKLREPQYFNKLTAAPKSEVRRLKREIEELTHAKRELEYAQQELEKQIQRLSGNLQTWKNVRKSWKSPNFRFPHRLTNCIFLCEAITVCLPEKFTR